MNYVVIFLKAFSLQLSVFEDILLYYCRRLLLLLADDSFDIFSLLWDREDSFFSIEGVVRYAKAAAIGAALTLGLTSVNS